ncbi:nucleoside diphosphate-linked moiety x motif 18-like protein [Dermatophagoides farinae]|nr:nucleoside diphosphate-linked moiety x motif 18-like protein [Dermatophagoides farinae]
MDSQINKIEAILNGTIIDNSDKEFLQVDYSLGQQNDESNARGIDAKVSNEFGPKIGLNVTFIVTAVIFNERQEVLMIQEARSTCSGSWYLPAGRVQPKELLETAIERAVLAESGLCFQPISVIKVESSHGNWFRFVYIGRITGGQLKTVSKADEQSLQACYVDDAGHLSLRSRDCLPLIEFARDYYRNGQSWHSPQLICRRYIPNLYMRLVIASWDQQIGKHRILIAHSLSPHLPICQLNPTRSVYSTLKRFMQYLFGGNDGIPSNSAVPPHKPLGLMAIEHDFADHTDQYDGLCLTLLVHCKHSDSPLHSGFTWTILSVTGEQLLVDKLSSRFKTIAHSVL